MPGRTKQRILKCRGPKKVTILARVGFKVRQSFRGQARREGRSMQFILERTLSDAARKLDSERARDNGG